MEQETLANDAALSSAHAEDVITQICQEVWDDGKNNEYWHLQEGRIFSGLDLNGSKTYPVPGQFLIASSSRLQPLRMRIGYVVQIREGCGQFSSDMYFIRLFDGGLMTMENESYYALKPDQEKRLRQIFSDDPAEETKQPLEYTIKGQYPKTGFVISDRDTPGTPDVPFGILMKSRV